MLGKHFVCWKYRLVPRRGRKVRRREKKKIGDVENNISGNPAELRQICCNFGDCSAGCGIFRRADGGDTCNGAKRRAVFDNHDLYDLRLLSTLGFEKDSVDAFTGREDVKAVEGAVSSGFLAVDESGKSRVLVAQTLLEVQNQVELKAGRLPEAGG